MPERTEVHHVARVLNEIYAGAIVNNIEIDTNSRYVITQAMRNDPSWRTGRRAVEWRVKTTFETNLARIRTLFPLKILKVRDSGKKIIFELCNPDQTVPSVWLVSFLSMEGRWIPYPIKPRGDHSNLWLNIQRQQGRLAIEEVLFFNDTRHFGTLQFCFSTDELKSLFTGFGPDILYDDLSPTVWGPIINNGRIRQKQVGDFLLDQKRICGVGNWMRSEILYRAQLRPDRTLGSLTPAEKEKLRLEVLAVTKEAAEAHGLTIKSYWDPLGNKGEYKCRVYMQKTDPNGNTVVQWRFKDKRTTHWCPAVQGGLVGVTDGVPLSPGKNEEDEGDDE